METQKNTESIPTPTHSSLSQTTTTENTAISLRQKTPNSNHNTPSHPKRHLIPGFTLVELVIVITILAILGTIGFLSLQGYSSKARDGNRVASMTNIDKALQIHVIQAGSFPNPDGNIVYSGYINGQMLIQVGEVGENLSRVIKLNTTPKDPTNNAKYIYGTTYNNKHYQIAGLLENTTAYDDSSIFINQAYAEDLSSYEAKVSGVYPGYIKYSSGSEVFIANIPSLIFNNATGSVNLIADTTYYVVNKKKNLPYTTSGVRGTPETQTLSGNALIREITKSTTATLTGVNITNVTKDNFASTFTGAILASFNVSGGASITSESLVETLKTVVLGESATATYTPPSNNCATQPVYTGATFVIGTPTSHNQSWQGITSTGACYYTCRTGKVLDENICVSATCAGTTPDGTAKVSNATSFAGGTWNYNPVGAKCSYTCGTGYYTDNNGATCVLNQSNPTNLSLSHSTRNKTFTFSWTAGTGNGGSCKLQYNKNGIYTNISETTYNCDSNLTNQSVTLPGDGWYSGNWNGVQIRVIRTSDSVVLGAFSQTLTCSTTSGNSSSTPSIDEDCNGSWNNSTSYDYCGSSSYVCTSSSYVCTEHSSSCTRVNGVTTCSNWCSSGYDSCNSGYDSCNWYGTNYTYY